MSKKNLVLFFCFLNGFGDQNQRSPYGEVSDFGAGSSPPWKQSASPVRTVVGPWDDGAPIGAPVQLPNKQKWLKKRWFLVDITN